MGFRARLNRPKINSEMNKKGSRNFGCLFLAQCLPDLKIGFYFDIQFDKIAVKMTKHVIQNDSNLDTIKTISSVFRRNL